MPVVVRFGKRGRRIRGGASEEARQEILEELENHEQELQSHKDWCDQAAEAKFSTAKVK